MLHVAQVLLTIVAKEKSKLSSKPRFIAALAGVTLFTFSFLVF